MSMRFCLEGFDGPSGWAPFPTQPEILEETRENGEKLLTFISPPILYGKKAYRYKANKVYKPDGTLSHTCNLSFVTQSGEAWTHYVSKNNWAGMVFAEGPHAFGHFTSISFSQSVPVALYKKWFPDLVRFLYAENKEELDKKLGEHASYLDYEKRKAKEKRDAKSKHEDRFGVLEHGDVAITNVAYNFADYGEHRVYYFFNCPSLKKRGLSTFVKHNGRFCAVHIRKSSMKDFAKVCPEAFEDYWPQATAHQRMEVLELARAHKAGLESGEIKAPKW